jgi:hypothetical protein
MRGRHSGGGRDHRGQREVLCLKVDASEAEPFWTEFLRSLNRRGLRVVKLVISDSHEGLKVAASKVLKATWQRCRVHFMRNASAHACQQGAAAHGLDGHWNSLRSRLGRRGPTQWSKANDARTPAPCKRLNQVAQFGPRILRSSFDQYKAVEFESHDFRQPAQPSHGRFRLDS